MAGLILDQDLAAIVDRVPEALARYAAGFRRGDGGWRVSRLEVRLVGVGAEARG
jgi:hypothetical protein